MTWTTWLLIGAALVFLMQCGFAMVETGFTRAKNTGNILFKNFVDFCIGCVCFLFLGFGLMMGVDYVAGFIGVPNLDIFTCFDTLFAGEEAVGAEVYEAAVTTASSFTFNLVFCATAATIVSGAMAERTRFLAYCIYSAMISLIVYPVEAGWVWNSQGWLVNLGVGFVDFAGSGAIHMVGGTASLIGIIFLGARIGKFERDESGKVVKVNAIQGHNMTIGALGVLLLWFGWYGFNGAAANETGQLARIFVTTTIAPSVALLVAMIYTWIRNKKPDLVMSMNASLAGLVGVTAGCSNVDIIGSLVIGVVSGFLVMGVTWLLEHVLHLDDCVGAVPVHFANGIWGIIAVGLFDVENGLFYSGNAELLGIQLLGIITILAWTAVWMTIFFAAIKYVPVMIKYKTVKPSEIIACGKTWNGLRCNPEEEIIGLDISEHGLTSSIPTSFPRYLHTTARAKTWIFRAWLPQQSTLLPQTRPSIPRLLS